MFKIGDIVVCVDKFNDMNIELFITLDKKYDVLNIKEEIFPYEKVSVILINNDNNKLTWYNWGRFISLSESRRQKIFKLKKRI